MNSKIKSTLFKIWGNEYLFNELLKYNSEKQKRYLAELYISKSCTLNCKHCYIGNPDISLLSQSRWVEIVNALTPITTQFHISGKEPIGDLNAEYLLRYLVKNKKKFDIKVTTITNGQTFFSDYDTTSKLDNLEISLDGLQKENDFIRGNGSFCNTINSIRKYRDVLNENQISISCVLNKINLQKLINLIVFTQELGISRLFFQVFKPISNRISNKLLNIDASAFFNFIESLESFLALNQSIMNLSIKICIPNFFSEDVLKNKTMKSILINFLENGVNCKRIGNNNFIIYDFDVFDIPYWKTITIMQNGALFSGNAANFYWNNKKSNQVDCDNLTNVIENNCKLHINQLKGKE